jgi:hypothetical protein
MTRYTPRILTHFTNPPVDDLVHVLSGGSIAKQAVADMLIEFAESRFIDFQDSKEPIPSVEKYRREETKATIDLLRDLVRVADYAISHLQQNSRRVNKPGAAMDGREYFSSIEEQVIDPKTKKVVTLKVLNNIKACKAAKTFVHKKAK